MNNKIIFLSEIIQNIWWIIISLALHFDDQIIIVALSSLGVIIKYILVKYFTNLQKFHGLIGKVILMLINAIIYTEANILMYQQANPFSNHTCTLFIVSNQQIISEMVSERITYHIFKYCYPCYLILRLFSIVFISFDYFIIESIIIILIFTSLIFIQDKSNQTAKIRLSLCLNDESISKGFSSRRQEVSPQIPSKLKSIPLTASCFMVKNDQIEKNENLKNHQIEKLDAFKGRFFQSKSFLDEMLKSQSQMKKKKEHVEEQLSFIFHNLHHHFKEGIMIINSFQKVQFMNKKLEKLLGSQNEETVLENLKMCLQDIQIDPTEAKQGFQFHKHRRIEINQQFLEDILRQSEQNNIKLDVLDVLLNPQKYISQYYPNFVTYDGEQSYDETFPDQISEQSQILFQTGFSKKKLKIAITPAYFTHSQIEKITNKFENKQQFDDELQQPILLILVKNITQKLALEGLEKDNILNNLLLKQFSYSLRNPLNINQQMLNLIQQLLQEEELQQFISIAQCSNQQLFYQINDILDFTALIENKFNRRFSKFLFTEILTEIENMYIQEMKLKHISFSIRICEGLVTRQIYQDKQRILQVLVNLLNNSCKYTKYGEEISISFICLDETFIEVKVHDTGVKMNNQKITALKHQFKINQTHKHLQEIEFQKELGLGLLVSTKIVQGFIESNDNFLDIETNVIQGNNISFWIQDFDQGSQQDSPHVRNPQITGKFVNLVKSLSHDNIITKKYYDDIVDDGNKEMVELKLNTKISFESPNFDENSQQQSISVPQTNYFKFKLPDPPQFIENNTYSFKLSTIQLHECSLTCRRVLIVDDTAFNQYAMQAFLLNFKILCDEAQDGIQALLKIQSKFSTSCQHYELIFIDIEMPGLNGFQVIQEIISLGTHQFNIIVCSAYDSVENISLSEKAGAKEFLKKPINYDELLAILRKYQLVK